VVLAGVTFGRRAGVLVGVVAGLLMGPLMPLDVAAGIDQPLRGWLIRMAFYVAIGALAGYARHRFSRLLDRRRAFLSSVSHELRTPLSAVMGFAQILDREWGDVPDSEKREMIGHILRESVEVAHVVDDILVAARIESGSLHIQCEQIDVRQIADSILDSLPGDLGASRVRIGGFAQSWADPVRVRQIVRNLITNALIHGDLVSVDLRNDPGKVVVSIRHDGPGIPDAILPRLFEPFDQIPKASAMPQAVGLGLAVCRELARRMGGRLNYCREGDHSTFTLELPGAKPVAPKANQPVR